MQPRIPSTAFADAWTKVDHTEDPGFFVNLLDATRVELLERARREPETFFASHALRPGLRVLDVGCGTGDMLRLIAPLVSPGRCVGVDLSETMVAEAKRRASEPSEHLSFQLADAQALALDDASFDRVTATQVLVHLPQPAAALSEFHRVLAPGGILVIGEVDWPATGIESSNRELSRRFTQLASDGLRNGHIVREIAWLLQEAGFAEIRLSPEVTVAREAGAFQRWFIEPALRHFIAIQAFTEIEATEFLADLRHRSETGHYFLTRTSYSITAVRPA